MTLNPRSRHVTHYAARNALEDFTESYAVFAGAALNLEEGPHRRIRLKQS